MIISDFFSLQMYGGEDRVHEAASPEPAQVQLLPLHGPDVRPQRPEHRGGADLLRQVHRQQ